MKRILALLLFAALPAQAANVGAPAPEFALENIAGGSVKLSQYRGKHVVLEWVNPDCPYVRKHYGSANMQRLQKDHGPEGWPAVHMSDITALLAEVERLSLVVRRLNGQVDHLGIRLGEVIRERDVLRAWAERGESRSEA